MRVHPYFILIVLFVFIFLLPQNVLALSSDKVIEEINSIRASEGLPPLRKNPLLEASAKEKVQELIRRGSLVHTSSPPGKAWQILAKEGYNYLHAGENLAVNIFSEEEIVDEWVNSSSHRKNIVYSGFTEIGVAIKEGMYKGRWTTYGVAYFGEPKAKPATSRVGISFTTNKNKEADLIKELTKLLDLYIQMLRKYR